jgi:hypothetical protein
MCGDCGKKYSFEELMKLKRVKLVETDSDVKPLHGYTNECSCGYTFHKDKWMLKTPVWIGNYRFEVSSVFLEMNYAFDNTSDGIWYETMVFHRQVAMQDLLQIDVEIECGYSQRYGTKQEAEANHSKIVAQMRAGGAKIEGKTLILDEEWNKYSGA